jgi:hypothetical protein
VVAQSTAGCVVAADTVVFDPVNFEVPEVVDIAFEPPSVIVIVHGAALETLTVEDVNLSFVPIAMLVSLPTE